MILSTIFILFYINQAVASCADETPHLATRNLKATQSVCDNTMQFNLSFADYPLTIEIAKQLQTIYTIASISTLSASDMQGNLNAYTATSFEFRSPSEHQIEGIQYDLEMLIHHQLQEGLISNSQMAIVSILFKIDTRRLINYFHTKILLFIYSASTCKLQSQPFFDDYYFRILKHQNTTTLTINFHNSLGSQIPLDPTFYTYMGTFNSHLLDCKQLVQWYVLDIPLPISSQQVAHFNYFFRSNETINTQDQITEVIDLLKLKGAYCESHLARDFGLFLAYCAMIFIIYKSI